MSSQCVKCKQVGNPSDFAKCVGCGSLFHPACTKGGDRKYQRAKDKANWRCELCTVDALSGAGHTGSDSDVGEDKNSILKAISKLDTKMDKKHSEMQASFNRLSTEIQQINARVNSMQEENKALKDNYNTLKKDNEDMAAELQDLRSQVYDLQQYSRCNNLEVVGVPSTANENVYEILKCISQTLGVQFKDEDICIAHRLQKSAQKPHPSIIVRFVSRRTREAWLSAARQVKSKISAEKIHPSLQDVPVFINEHLSGYTKMLLGKARAQVRAGRLAHAWVTNAKVLVRKLQGGPAFRITSHEDLDKLVLK